MNPRGWLLAATMLVLMPLVSGAARDDEKRPGGGPSTALMHLVSWNLEWFADPRELDAAGFWRTCQERNWPNQKPGPGLPMCDVYRRSGIFSAADYDARKVRPLRAALAEAASRGLDILAVQETRGPDALQAVLPPGYRVACFTTRDDAQNVGFAIREAAGWQMKCREIRALSLEDEPGARHLVRRGLELVVRIDGRNVALLNVHLKSGCPGGRLDKPENPACPVLQQQAEPLEQWVELQADGSNPFLIVGDWNRDLEQEVRGRFEARSDRSDPAGPIDPVKVRNLFPELDDGKPAESAMEVVMVDRSAASRRGCHTNLDQLVVSRSLRSMLDPALLPDGRIAAALVRPPAKASDHCLLEAVLPFKQAR